MAQGMRDMRGLSMLLWLHSDRMMAIAMVALGLLAGAFVGQGLLAP